MRAIVVGSGISGLSIAYLLKRENLDVLVLEKSNKSGGKIHTIKENNYLVEAGPNGFLYNENTINFIKESGFENQLIKAKNEQNRKFIFDGRLYEIPQKQYKLLFDNFLSLKTKLNLLKEPFVKPNPNDETVAEFVTRRLGREFLDKLIGPMSLGIYAADPFKMSMQSNFKRIKEIELTYGSLIKGLINLIRQKKAKSSSASGQFAKELYSFKGGMQSFTDYLSRGLDVILNCKVNSIEKHSKYKLITSMGNFEADIVVFAIEAYAAAQIIEHSNYDLYKKLTNIAYSPIVLIALGFDKKFKNDVVDSYGYLFDLKRIKNTIGVLFDSSIFENRSPINKFLVRMFLGGAIRKEVIEKNNQQLIKSAIEELQRSAKIFAPFEYFKIVKYINAIPQYSMNHNNMLANIQEFESQNKRLYFAGNAFYGVGFNDCINNAYNLIKKIKSI